MKLEEIHWENASAKEHLQKLGGSKSGAHAFLHDTQPKLRPYLPKNTHYLEPGGNIDKILRRVDVRNPVVVRGCHPLDVTGMVDVIPTELNVSGRKNIRAAILYVLEAAQREDVKSFVEYESEKPFTGDIGILVQDYCKGVTGSIIEHPHEKGIFRIGINNGRRIHEDVYNKDGEELFSLSEGMQKHGTREATDDGSVSLTSEREVIDLYRKVRDSGLMPDSHSFQMEFVQGNNIGGLRFLQARLFRPFAPYADFDPIQACGDAEYKIHTEPFDVFGITPPEGSPVMPRAELTAEFVRRRKKDQNVAYAYNNYDHHMPTPLSVRPENMAAYLPYQISSVLEHGHFRWMQKAALSLIGKGREIKGREAWNCDARLPTIQKISETVKLRIFSDGFCGVVVFE